MESSVEFTSGGIRKYRYSLHFVRTRSGPPLTVVEWRWIARVWLVPPSVRPEQRWCPCCTRHGCRGEVAAPRRLSSGDGVSCPSAAQGVRRKLVQSLRESCATIRCSSACVAAVLVVALATVAWRCAWRGGGRECVGQTAAGWTGAAVRGGAELVGGMDV